MSNLCDAAGRGLRRVRVIPTILIDGRGRMVKTVGFGKRVYIGDPINAVKIYNSKEVDELVLLDIDAAREQRGPCFSLIEDIVGEAFMPVAYGGGVKAMDEINRLYSCGIEKVILSSVLSNGTSLISEAANRYGNQSVVVCIPVKRSLFGKPHVRIVSGTRVVDGSPVEVARRVVVAGAGELIVYSIDRDGRYTGYDIPLLKQLSDIIEVPVVACGGARDLADIRAAIIEAGCSAAAAGSMFVYSSATRGVLISYPSEQNLRQQIYDKLTNAAK